MPLAVVDLLKCKSKSGRTFALVPVDAQSPSLARIWMEHLCVVGGLQAFEHAPFFLTAGNIRHLPSAILYVYIHAMTVIWALCTLNEVSLP